MRVVFFGTPEFAVPSLEALLGEGFDVAAVVTQPDRPQGRSRHRLEPSPVKRAATAEDVPVLQPERPSDPAFVAEVRALAPDIGVVVAYGHILKPELLAVPRAGMVNVHPSLLPELRGAAPIPWAIMSGLTRSGVSIMQLDSGMDSGPILRQLAEPLPSDVTGGELSGHYAELGAEALVETLLLIDQGAVEPEPQDARRATYAPKITRATARIDWTESADRVAQRLRALDPDPGAWTELDGRVVKLFGATSGGSAPSDARPGDIVGAGEDLAIASGLGVVRVGEVQPAGKARMPVAAWVRGRGVRVAQHFA